jgi:hypothetical protein
VSEPHDSRAIWQDILLRIAEAMDGASEDQILISTGANRNTPVTREDVSWLLTRLQAPHPADISDVYRAAGRALCHMIREVKEAGLHDEGAADIIATHIEAQTRVQIAQIKYLSPVIRST